MFFAHGICAFLTVKELSKTCLRCKVICDRKLYVYDLLAGHNLYVRFGASIVNPIVLFQKMGDRYNIHSQLEHLQSKYIGTGHADTNKWEWLTNQHRDSYVSYMGHFDMNNYFAIAENETKARVRFALMEKMVQPCGPPPERPED